MNSSTIAFRKNLYPTPQPVKTFPPPLLLQMSLEKPWLHEYRDMESSGVTKPGPGPGPGPGVSRLANY